MKSCKRTIFLTLACAMFCGAVVLGQATSGTISGTMLDPQGNALPGATVRIKNVATSATREVASNSDGTTLNDALNNTPGSAQGLLIGVETIKEFRVLTNTYSAEYGRAARIIIHTPRTRGSRT